MSVNCTAKSLYTPQLEHDACGIGFIAQVDGLKSHAVLHDALTMLENMEHRGGKGSSPKTGDGAGVLIQIPHGFLKKECAQLNIPLPGEDAYGVGMIFFPRDNRLRQTCKEIIRAVAENAGLSILGYRKVPVNHHIPGPGAADAEPFIEQMFVTLAHPQADLQQLERKLFVLRNAVTHRISSQVKGASDFYMVSCSARTLVYKGQLRTEQLRQYYDDLRNDQVITALAMVHSRFSTNTFPNWKLAQPFRYIAHNGEINTIRGNVNKMKSKEALFRSPYFTTEEVNLVLPITNPEYSDSANLDALVEILTLTGRPLPHVMMMLVPEAWQDNKQMDPHRKAFYKYHASLMEPWDGPAALIFTDGLRIGATLDRNGLRPLRYCITQSGRVIASSEAGALPVPASEVIEKGRISPGRMLLVDLTSGRILKDEEIKQQVYQDKKYYQWIIEKRIKLRLEPVPENFEEQFRPETLTRRQLTYGYTSEDIKTIIQPMAEKGYEPVGSMGDDTPLAVLSKESRHVSNYFKQHFAQVTNPPIDPIRERLVMSLFTRVGPNLNILEESAEHAHQIHISHPVLLNADVARLKNMTREGFTCAVIDCWFAADGKPGRMKEALRRICEESEKAVHEGCSIILLSDKRIDEDRAPIPSLLAVGTVHHHLIEKHLRAHTGLVVEAGDAWEVHHFATLIGYGASAVNPYLAFETIHVLNSKNAFAKNLTDEQAFHNYQKAIGNGLLKVMSKMGISTLESYQGAQIFEALGLNSEVIDTAFRGTISRIEGLGFDDLAAEVLVRHRLAFATAVASLPAGGIYQWKRTGEKHLFSPETIHLLQHAARTNNYELYKKYAAKINEQVKNQFTLRGLLEFKERIPVPIEEVEPVEAIVKRFSTGAMSFGSLSHEAHTTLAIAMNRLGAKSNSGEGGEDECRYLPKPNGDSERSAIKQVASARFGVTSYYLSQADELQIKMAQGAKPGEGGQLPGDKVDEWIARVRHSTPGVGLISPPPHHDIYSIEDLAQLIFDLKNANPSARINVKLVSQAGVGTVAAGVAKAKAEAILISGGDGGTGASPISSIRHTGLPWELGLAETHQTLVKNNLRSRVVLQTDGQIRTGRDLAIATLLGAEEWGVATAALVVAGCIMMRKCHLNTCPVGVATQDPELRKLFTGKPEHLVNFFRFLAQELREIMAQLGFRTIHEMIGRTDVLRVRKDVDHWKVRKLDLSPLLYRHITEQKTGQYKQIDQDFELEKVLDRKIIHDAKEALSFALPVKLFYPVKNTDRAVGTLLSYEISKRYGSKGLPDDTIHIGLNGPAGQSFGAFAAKGITLVLEGEANDYFGKGLSGARLVVFPDRKSSFRAEENIIIGNVALYGATSGEAFIRGQAGERFAVRNSGAIAVVEGVGDHGCEYMTGGRVVVLGPVGKNFAAGMSGGIAYILKTDQLFEACCNTEMVELEEPDEEDIRLLISLLEKHYHYTQSSVAAGLMACGQEIGKLFFKVMPKDYKKVLEQKRVVSTVKLV
ncbi:MAG: glutamate synthase large subunit [Cyclobacteriaceae bacterium]|nr:glutamate synthase large subunit [Cyclobacteriaceae bacterium]